MSVKIILAENSTEPSTWETFTDKAICPLLAERFGEFPENGRIYHNVVSVDNDVTPRSPDEVERLQGLTGTLYVIIYPCGVVGLLIVLAISILVSVLLAPDPPPPGTLKNQSNKSPNNDLSGRQNRARPKGRIPDIFGTLRSTPDLIAPTYTIWEGNQPIENSLMCIGRGEYDISADEVKDDTTPVEQIDGTTVEIYKPFVKPSPASPKQLVIGEAIGNPFVSTVKNNAVNGQVLRAPNSGTVQGDNDITYYSYYRTVGPHKHTINILQTSGVDFRDFFNVDDSVLISNASISTISTIPEPPVFSSTNMYFALEDEVTYIYAQGLPGNFIAALIQGATFNWMDSESNPRTTNLDGFYRMSPITSGGGYIKYLVSWAFFIGEGGWAVNPGWFDLSEMIDQKTEVKSVSYDLADASDTFNLNGTYEIESVSEYQIILKEPNLVNSEWNRMATTRFSNVASTLFENQTDTGVGPFIIESDETSEIMLNFSAQQGLYKASGTTQTAITIDIEIEATPIDDNGIPTGAAETFETVLTGSGSSKSSRSVTGRFALAIQGRTSLRAKRLTDHDYGFTGTVSDEIKWTELYGASSIADHDFGNVTLVRSHAMGTQQATAIKKRKLNMLVTRKVPQRISGSTFTTELFPTNNAAEIISAIALDPYIGNRSIDEMDFDNIYDTVAEIEAYFGTSDATEFCYTFDNDNMSFEETMHLLAKAVFCNAYRRGSQIKLLFEKKTANSVLLLNHRNKLPGSEKRTIDFGKTLVEDGIEFEWVDPADDSTVIITLPDDSAIRPKKMSSVGIRNVRQANFHAYRAWNKLRYQTLSTDFEATQEVALLTVGERFLNADNTRQQTQDGDVVNQLGLELFLSQDIEFEIGETYTISLQHYDGSVENIPVEASPLADKNIVVLQYAPKQALAIADELYARATFIITKDGELDTTPFILIEKDPQSNFVTTIKAINYDDRYYDYDTVG